MAARCVRTTSRRHCRNCLGSSLRWIRSPQDITQTDNTVANLTVYFFTVLWFNPGCIFEFVQERARSVTACNCCDWYAVAQLFIGGSICRDEPVKVTEDSELKVCQSFRNSVCWCKQWLHLGLRSSSSPSVPVFEPCSPPDHGLGLETARDQNFAVYVLVLVLVLKHWSRLFSRPITKIYYQCMRSKNYPFLYRLKPLTQWQRLQFCELHFYQDEEAALISVCFLCQAHSNCYCAGHTCVSHTAVMSEIGYSHRYIFSRCRTSYSRRIISCSHR